MVVLFGGIRVLWLFYLEKSRASEALSIPDQKVAKPFPEHLRPWGVRRQQCRGQESGKRVQGGWGG